MCHVAQRGRPDVKRRARVNQPHGTKDFAYVGRIVYCHQKEKGKRKRSIDREHDRDAQR